MLHTRQQQRKGKSQLGGNAGGMEWTCCCARAAPAQCVPGSHRGPAMFWKLVLKSALSLVTAHCRLKCGLLHLPRIHIVVMVRDIMREVFLFSASTGFSSILFPSLYFCIFKGQFIFLRSSLQGDSSTSSEPIMLPVTPGIHATKPGPRAADPPRSKYSPTCRCWGSCALDRRGAGAAGTPCWTLRCPGCSLGTHHPLQKHIRKKHHF